MLTVNGIAGARQQVAVWRKSGERIAFVPTMGNLHAGHLALVEQAKSVADRVVASIFVNPMQFGPGEDFARYPRTLADDSEKLAQIGTSLLFAPPVEEVYPAGHRLATRIEVPEVSEGLCGEYRPGHFTGVATIVAKLFNIVQPDVALFGEKDYQQLLVIRRMVTDLCIPVEIIGVPTVRESDGLAMSSRNGYLSSEARSKAPALYKALQTALERIKSGEKDFGRIEAEAMAGLEKQGFRPEYFAIRQAETLVAAGPEDNNLRLLAAAYLENTRLIDNIGLSLVK